MQNNISCVESNQNDGNIHLDDQLQINYVTNRFLIAVHAQQKTRFFSQKSVRQFIVIRLIIND